MNDEWSDARVFWVSTLVTFAVVLLIVGMLIGLGGPK